MLVRAPVSPATGMARYKAARSPAPIPVLTISPRVTTLPRARTVCWYQTQYASLVLPDDRVWELQVEKLDIGRYDNNSGTVHTDSGDTPVWTDKISENKKKLNKAFADHAAKARVSDKNTWEAHKALMLAMAMQECSHMDIHQRDFTKDNNPDKSANCTIFNLSVDFIERTQYFASLRGGKPLTPELRNKLNSEQGLLDAVGILEEAFSKWGIENTIAFVRQGSSGYNPQQGGDWRQQHGFHGVAAKGAVPKSNPIVYNICEYLACIKRSLRYIDQHPEIFYNDERPNIPCEYC